MEVDVDRLTLALMARGLDEYVAQATELAQRANEARRMNADAVHPAQVVDFYEGRDRDKHLEFVAQGEALIGWIGRMVATVPAQPPEGESLDPLVAAIDSMFDLPSPLSAAERLNLIDSIRAAGSKITEALSDPRFKFIRPKSQRRGPPHKDFDLQLLVAVAFRYIHPEGQHTAYGDRRSNKPIIQMALAFCEAVGLVHDEDQADYRLGIIHKKIASVNKGDMDTRSLYLSDINPEIFDPAEFFADCNGNKCRE